MRRGEQTALDRELLWEAGMVNPCTRHAKVKECRYTPCTAVNDVDCCVKCPHGCRQPCPMSGKATTRKENAK